jgi:hypothetical protein
VKLHLTKSISAAMIMIILTLSIISTGNFLVSADPGGIGKYVTLSFEGADPKDPAFYVTATKDSSEQFWIYPDPITEEMTQKLGAGSIVLIATHPPGYSVSWKLGEAPDAPVIADKDSIVFKSEKYAEIIVIFQQAGYALEITYSLNTDPDWGTWSVYPDKSSYKEGDVITITFSASDGYHLSSVLDNNEFANLTETQLAITYTITFHEDHNVIVAFDSVGVATVPAGSAVTVFLRNSFGVGSLFFTGTSDDGTAEGGALRIDPGDGTSVVFWEVSADAWLFAGSNYVILAIPLGDNDLPDYIYTADEKAALLSDVDGDGEVTHDDMVEVAIAISSLGRTYDPKYDTNDDGHLNQKDVRTVQDYIGTSLDPIEWVAYDPNGFYGFTSQPPPAQWTYDAISDLILIQTDHFSIFRGR